MLIIDVNTENMYRSYIDAMSDVIWNSACSGEGVSDNIEKLKYNIESLCYEKFEEIRIMFDEGYTCVLIPEVMEWIDNSSEVDIMLRVFGRNGVLLGTLTKSQLRY
jgi:hypothetical protein